MRISDWSSDVCSSDLLAAIGIDILVDGLVLGLAFVAGEKAGFLLTIALTLEVLFLGLTLTNELAETYRSRLRIIVIVRSEDHTSELQSLMRISYAVFCLKKKTTTITQ